MRSIHLSLVSHTNVGKTTLARTLLRREIGEVRDEAHVTEVSEAHVLLETEGDLLQLWDTPGFGDSVRLLTRLRKEGRPIGWMLHQVWDRFANRPLWCSQEAVRNVKEHADVVLYLVNASEEPGDAGYVGPELELLGWIGRPVMVLLNQAGTEGSRLVESWSVAVGDAPVVRDVLSLDAFARCWTEEVRLLERVTRLLDGPKREAMIRLAKEWNSRNVAVFHSSCEAIAGYLVAAAADRESPSERRGERGTLDSLKQSLKLSTVDRKRAMGALNERLDRWTRQLMQHLIVAHELVGDSEERIERRIRDYQVTGGTALDEKSGAVAGAVVSGALGGLAADALSGGLTLGGGMIAGGILGALGGTMLAKGYRLVAGSSAPAVTWTPEFLDRLFEQALLRYLAVAHFGRGRGDYRDLERPAHWIEAVQAQIEDARRAVSRQWEQPEPEEMQRLVERTLGRILQDAYPDARF